jgi:hypothetical protein
MAGSSSHIFSNSHRTFLAPFNVLRVSYTGKKEERENPRVLVIERLEQTIAIATLSDIGDTHSVRN